MSHPTNLRRTVELFVACLVTGASVAFDKSVTSHPKEFEVGRQSRTLHLKQPGLLSEI